MVPISKPFQTGGSFGKLLGLENHPNPSDGPPSLALMTGYASILIAAWSLTRPPNPSTTSSDRSASLRLTTPPSSFRLPARPTRTTSTTSSRTGRHMVAWLLEVCMNLRMFCVPSLTLGRGMWVRLRPMLQRHVFDEQERSDTHLPMRHSMKTISSHGASPRLSGFFCHDLRGFWWCRRIQAKSDVGTYAFGDGQAAFFESQLFHSNTTQVSSYNVLQCSTDTERRVLGHVPCP